MAAVRKPHSGPRPGQKENDYPGFTTGLTRERDPRGREAWMKRTGIAFLLLLTHCWAQSLDGFTPASTKVWDATYPRVGLCAPTVPMTSGGSIPAAGTRESPRSAV